jgi:LCP family protein required for cell wall assembly
MINPVRTTSFNLAKIEKSDVYKGLLLAALSTLVSLLLIILIFLSILCYQINIFAKTSGVSKVDLLRLAQTTYNQAKTPLTDPITVLVLGLDKLETRGDAPVLTDTILFATIDFDKKSISLLPLPRDLWSEITQSRINTLYHQALEVGAVKPEEQVSSVLSELTGITIHHELVIQISDLSELIDLMGGIEIEVPESFTDTQFPRTDVDVTTENDVEKLYKTVHFDAGRQHMNGTAALEYIRSRKSSGAQGNDLARSQRQQQVIMAIFTGIKDPRKLINPQYSGKLLKFYIDNFSKYLTLEEVSHIGASLGKEVVNLSFNNRSISVYPEDENGVIIHPDPLRYNGQWLYIVRDQEKFREHIIKQLFSDDAGQHEQTIESTTE